MHPLLFISAIEMAHIYIIAALVVFVVSGVFSMFGKGGGSIYTPVLVWLGFDIGKAISTALFLNLITALVATIVFIRNRLVEWKFCMVFIPGTVVGSLLGAYLSASSPRELLLGIFGVFLVFAGILMLTTSKGEGGTAQAKPLTLKEVLVVIAVSFGVGVLSSLIGVGGGLIIFPFLVLYMGYQAQKAAGANAFIVTISSLMGTIGHFAIGHADYALLVLAGVASALGSAIGSNVTVKASPKFVKVAFAFILWFFAGQIFYGLIAK